MMIKRATFASKSANYALKDVPWHKVRYPESVTSTDKDVILLFYRPRRGWDDDGTYRYDTSISSTRPHAPISFMNFLHGRNKVDPMNSEVQEVPAHGDIVPRIDTNQHEQDTNKTPKNSTTRNIIRQQADDSRTRDDFDVQGTNKYGVHAATQTEGDQSLGHTYHIQVNHPSGPVFIGDKCHGSTINLQNNVDDESDV